MVNEYNKQQVDEANKISEIEFNIMTAFGDMIEIHEKLKTNSKSFDEMNYEELKEFTFLHSHCSAIFKAKEDLTNVFMAHNSWYYYSMIEFSKNIISISITTALKLNLFSYLHIPLPYPQTTIST